jgi:putative tryptophan/tyrosine transport system substrate-binding protein
MKKLLLTLMLSYLFCVQNGVAEDILVLQSLSIKPYNDALQGCRSVCKAKTQKLISSGLSEAEIVRKVRKARPDLIIAIGQDALVKASSIRDVPVVYIMVLNPESLIQENVNITGVCLNIEPEKQLAQLRMILPHAKTIGLLFDPSRSGIFIGKAYNAASLMGINLLTKAVYSSREAIASIEDLKGKVDALWLIPDITVVNPATIELLLLSAIENRIPVFTFSEKILGKGALLSMEVDAVEAGRQAGEIVKRVLAGGNMKNLEKEYARASILTINPIIAKKLGINISDNTIKQAKIIR